MRGREISCKVQGQSFDKKINGPKAGRLCFLFPLGLFTSASETCSPDTCLLHRHSVTAGALNATSVSFPALQKVINTLRVRKLCFIFSPSFTHPSFLIWATLKGQTWEEVPHDLVACLFAHLTNIKSLHNQRTMFGLCLYLWWEALHKAIIDRR